MPDLGDTVRLKHLISHTSRYREFINSLLMSGRQITDIIRREEIFLILENQPAMQNKPGEIELHHRRMNPLPLKAESKDEFSAGFPIPNIKFFRNEKDEATGFEASSGRSLGVVFEKQ